MPYKLTEIPYNAVEWCNDCKHRTLGTDRCKAFDGGRIPTDVLCGKYDIKGPCPGGNGTKFEPLDKYREEYKNII